jgi:uncharacterized protein YaaQ
MNDSKIHQMMMVVVQEQDLEEALAALNALDIPALHMVSSGGFLGRRNATLIIGLPDHMEGDIISTLEKTCHKRVEYMAFPMEGSPLPMPSAMEITVGGATIFTFAVDRFEEI